MNSVEQLQKSIGYTFKNLNLLETALTHVSYANESGEESYERLEFLGDAIIELVVSDNIIKYKELDAGVLTKLRASLVSTENLSKISTMLSIMQSVKKSRSLSTLSKKNTADLFESLIGAIYIDSGLESARKVVEKYVVVSDAHIQEILKQCVDYKTKFQEDMQSKGNSFEYKVLNSSGLDHDKTFECGLYLNGVLVSKATGKSIHMAEEQCARLYYDNIKASK